MFNAAVIFAEHRFYGESQPFGNDSYASISNMGYLTSEQALADYAALLFALKTPGNGLRVSYPQNATVIAFGGSYGGMLSAWFRIKYPHVVTGAWAASAPLIYFRGGGVDQGAFDAITTKTFVNAGCNRFIVANSWNAILNLSSTDSGRAFLNNQFRIDPKSLITSTDGGWNLNYYFREAIEYMAMVDYPYPTGFLEPLPGWPVNVGDDTSSTHVACTYMNSPGSNFTDEQLATMMYNAANIYYNSTGSLQYNCIDPTYCGDPGTAGLGNDALGWPWQECSEIVIDMCSRGGTNDFFWDECGKDSIALLIEQCNDTFATFNWTTDVWNIQAVNLLYGLSLNGVSNIILTQGELDPWSGGGYKTSSAGVSQDRGIYVLPIPGAAHHLDLRTPNTCDPNTVANARYQIFLDTLDN
ncbi:serine carboxypeptidase S28 [Oesophagostomum dentatum]|uniref:Serine carboxypeptidase S28 n=1 Tax=Oesophagostomum dentatum TaxID=61180 RepID=A0A0B1SWG9_OESDE|nr:serine carboxypeptidase S28 [Oesophagostomum dentatum]